MGMINYLENNQADVIGYIDSEIVLSHQVHGEDFMTFILKVPRLSNTFDYINTTVSHRILTDAMNLGDKIAVKGQFRSYNNYSDVGNKLILTLFVHEIEKVPDSTKIHSEISLNGYICKEPVYRKTPFGREIADVLLAVNRAYNKSDYIPCIAWGRNARFCEKLAIGQNIKITGRVQSREYQKKISDLKSITKTAYEVSVSRIEIVENADSPAKKDEEIEEIDKTDLE